jgi:hypothetical protein
VQEQVAHLQQKSHDILQQLLQQRHNLTGEQQVEFDAKLQQWQSQQQMLHSQQQAQLQQAVQLQAQQQAAAQHAQLQAATAAAAQQQAAAAAAAAQQQQHAQAYAALGVPTTPPTLPGFAPAAPSGESQQLRDQTQHLKSLLGLGL